MFDRVFTVTLPTGMPASFPEECVGCGRPSPDGRTRLVTGDAGYGHALWAGWVTLRVPACRSCAHRLHLWRAFALVRTLLVGVAGVAFGIAFLLPRVSGFVTGTLVLVLVGASFLVFFVIDRRFPPSFHVDPRGPVTDYEFRDGSYAQRFAVLNGASPEQAA